jgi:fimbrial isopeptide formation D2 family protein
MLLTAATLFALFTLGMRNVSAQTSAGEGNTPPLVDFTKTVSPTAAIAGDVARYTIRFANPINASYAATVVVSDTLDTRLIVNTSSRTAQRADGSWLGEFQDLSGDDHTIAWSAEITPGDDITLTFDVTVTTGVTAAEVVTNTARLYEVGFETATLTATAPILLRSFDLALVTVARGIERFPSLVNGDFELGRNIRWQAEPENVIYAYADRKDLPPPAGSTANGYLAWIGGEDNTSNVLAQTVLLPRGYTSAGLRYKYWLESEEPTCNGDIATLTLSTPVTSAVKIYPILLCKQRNTQLPGQADGWRDNLIDLTDYIALVAKPTQDITLTIKVEAFLNERWVSSLWMDNIVLCTDQVSALGAEPCTDSPVKDFEP